MEFKIEKYSSARINDFPHDLRATRREELAADLEHAGQVMQLLG
jgi:hypothetical protein